MNVSTTRRLNATFALLLLSASLQTFAEVPTVAAAAGALDSTRADRIVIIEPADLSFCWDDGNGLREIRNELGVTLGYFCIIRPSDTNPLAFDLDPNRPAEDSGNGFGYHVVAVPARMSGNSRVAVLISGGFGAAYSPIHLDHLDLPAGVIHYEQTLIDGLSANYIVVQPAYMNPNSVNRVVCSSLYDPVAAANPQCHLLWRTLILRGWQDCLGEPCEEVGHFGTGSTELDVANSFFQRLRDVITHLRSNELFLPTALQNLDWPRISVIGHSQGSGHAYLIAKHLRRVARACYMGGPRDYAYDIGEYAQWFTPVADGSITPLDDMRALISDQDAHYALSASLEHIGLVQGQHYRIVDDPEGTNGHFEVFTSPRHTPDRMRFCYPR